MENHPSLYAIVPLLSPNLIVLLLSLSHTGDDSISPEKEGMVVVVEFEKDEEVWWAVVEVQVEEASDISDCL